MLGLLGIVTAMRGDPLAGGLMMLFDSMGSSRKLEQEQLQIKLREEKRKIIAEQEEWKSQTASRFCMWAFGSKHDSMEKWEWIFIWNDRHGHELEMDIFDDPDKCLENMFNFYCDKFGVAEEAQRRWG